MRIFLIRHGETDACQIPEKINKDVCLNARGVNQIIRLLPVLPKPTRVMASPTIRTLESARLIARGKDVVVHEPRLWNKSDDYETNLTSLLHDLRACGDDEVVILVTHGRIIKMIYSLITHGRIDKDMMDNLILDYGDIFQVDTHDGRFRMVWTDGQ